MSSWITREARISQTGVGLDAQTWQSAHSPFEQELSGGDIALAPTIQKAAILRQNRTSGLSVLEQYDLRGDKDASEIARLKGQSYG